MKCKALYSVWRNSDDRVIIIDGTPEECAKAMGISVKSFFGTVSRVKSGVNRKWHIEVIYEGTKCKPPKYAPKRVQMENIRRTNEYANQHRKASSDYTRARKRAWYAKNKDRINEKRRKEYANEHGIRPASGSRSEDALVDLLAFLR